jgi:hypothetical protein
MEDYTMSKRINCLLLVIAAISMVALSACSPKLTNSEKDGIKYIYEVEKVARDTYTYFFDKWGTPVQLVVSNSEQNHMDIMKELIDKYNLGDPAAGKGYGEFSNSELQQLYHDLVARGSSSEVDALSTAAMIEEFDIVELRKNVANTNREDVLAAYSKLMAGSQNHLEIFTAKLKEKAVVYQPQYLSQQDYNQIIAAVANWNTTTATTATTNSTSTAPTFGELAVNGKQSYSSICINCHGESLSTGSASSVTLSKYQNAQKLLEKISGMPISGKQKQWEVLSYLLLEHNWVSGTTIFNPDTLSQIALSQ